MSDQNVKLSPENVWLGITPTLWWNDDFINIDIGIPFEQCVSEMALAGYSSLQHRPQVSDRAGKAPPRARTAEPEDLRA